MKILSFKKNILFLDKIYLFKYICKIPIYLKKFKKIKYSKNQNNKLIRIKSVSKW